MLHKLAGGQLADMQPACRTHATSFFSRRGGVLATKIAQWLAFSRKQRGLSRRASPYPRSRPVGVQRKLAEQHNDPLGSQEELGWAVYGGPTAESTECGTDTTCAYRKRCRLVEG
jgi:hypothetical protein